MSGGIRIWSQFWLQACAHHVGRDAQLGCQTETNETGGSGITKDGQPCHKKWGTFSLNCPPQTCVRCGRSTHTDSQTHQLPFLLDQELRPLLFKEKGTLRTSWEAARLHYLRLRGINQILCGGGCGMYCKGSCVWILGSQLAELWKVMELCRRETTLEELGQWRPALRFYRPPIFHLLSASWMRLQSDLTASFFSFSDGVFPHSETVSQCKPSFLKLPLSGILS